MLCHNMDNVQNVIQNNQIHVECNAVFHYNIKSPQYFILLFLSTISSEITICLKSFSLTTVFCDHITTT